MIAGIINASMDSIRFCWNSSIFSKIRNTKAFQFCNPGVSQSNKWKNGDPKQGEKFFGSSTFLVWTTDLWHLFKGLMIISLVLGTILYIPIFNPILDSVILFLSFTISFELFFSKIFKK
jgi:hypothetical protein